MLIAGAITSTVDCAGLLSMPSLCGDELVVAIALATSQFSIPRIPSVYTGPMKLAILNCSSVGVEAEFAPPPVLVNSFLYYATAFLLWISYRTTSFSIFILALGLHPKH